MKNNTRQKLNISRQDSEVLLYLLRHVYENQRSLASETGLSLGAVNGCLQRLAESGFLNRELRPTPLAQELAECSRPRSAVILAAGPGMRMVPINYSLPKALLEVRGERLIERVIRQLHEVGITEISVVVGFMKESFEEREQIHDSYTDYVNPYYMFWEGGADPTHQDIRLIGCLLDMTPEDLYFRFARPEYGLSIDDLDEIFHIGEASNGMNRQTSQEQNEVNDYDNLSFYRPSDLGLVRVIEVWREEVKPRYQCFDPLATSQIDKYFRCEEKDLPKILEINKQRKTMYDEQEVPKEERAYITSKEIVDKYWQYYFLAPDGRILCEGETPYDYKSHPFTVSFFPYVNGEIHPFMGFFLDQQRYINRTVMMGDMAMKNAAKGMTFLPLSLKPDSMTNEEYANQKSKFDCVFVYDDTKSRTGAKPEFYTHSAFNIGQTDMLQLQLNMIHEVSGVSGALQGKTPTSGTSAARYAMESQNSTTTIYPLIKKFKGFEERCARKKLVTIQQYYEEGRDVTPKGNDEQVFYRANACRNVKANISIKNSASSAAFLQLGNEMLDRLLQLGAIDPRIYLKYYDAPFTEKLAQDIDGYMNQLQQGQMPQQAVQVPGANQQQAMLASQLMQGGGQLYTRQGAGQSFTPAA